MERVSLAKDRTSCRRRGGRGWEGEGKGSKGVVYWWIRVAGVSGDGVECAGFVSYSSSRWSDFKDLLDDEKYGLLTYGMV